MIGRLRDNYAAVTATLALFVALGGTSYAVIKLPRNSVGGAQLRADAVSSPKIRNGSIRPGDLAPEARGARGPRGAPGPAGAAGAPGSIGAGGIIVRTRDALAARPPLDAGGAVSVATTTLPGGRWLVIATTQVSDFPSAAGGDTFRCFIAVDGVNRGLGKVTAAGNVAGQVTSSDVTLLEVVDKASPAVVALTCSHDSPIPAGSDARFDRAKLVAIPVDNADVAEVTG